MKDLIEINHRHKISCTSFGNGFGTETTDLRCDECGNIVMFETDWPTYPPRVVFSVGYDAGYDAPVEVYDAQQISLSTGSLLEGPLVLKSQELDPTLVAWLDHENSWDEFNEWHEEFLRKEKKNV